LSVGNTDLEAAPSRMECSGCGAVVGLDEPYPFRCPNAGDGADVDHVLVRRLDARRVTFQTDDGEQNPFIRYRGLFRSHHLASRARLGDDAYVEVVRRLDDAVAEVDGYGFRVTSFVREDDLSDALGFSSSGGVWVKNETGQPSGSHKGRHLMGLAIHLEVAERIGLVPPGDRDARPLAIASCGNAALAAAVVARAARRPLQVFIPTDADPVVVARLKELEADLATNILLVDPNASVANLRAFAREVMPAFGSTRPATAA